MKKIVAMSLLAGIMFFALGAKKAFSLSSTTFKDGSPIPKKCALNAAKGQNVSPQLNWSNLPVGTKSFAISCIDTNPVARRWVHWMLINIPPTATEIPEGGSLPGKTLALENSFKQVGYGGPNPPKGTGIHKYVFTIYALNTPALEVKAKFLSKAGLESLIKGKTLGKASLTGTYIK